MTPRMNQGADLPIELFGDAAGVKGGGAEVVENDGGGTPEGDERQHDRGGHDEAYATRGCCDCFLEGHSVLTSGCALTRSARAFSLLTRREKALPARRTRLSVERMDRSVNAAATQTCHVMGQRWCLDRAK